VIPLAESGTGLFSATYTSFPAYLADIPMAEEYDEESLLFLIYPYQLKTSLPYTEDNMAQVRAATRLLCR
jgi:hypothetical protein